MINLEMICQMDQKTLLRYLTIYLQKKKYKVHACSKFIFARGTSNVTLVAHLDTIQEGIYDSTPDFCLYDERKDMFYALGGGTLDDRLGVAAIIEIIEDGFRPNIIFTTDEEAGGIGAIALVHSFPYNPPFPTDFFIELDRQGFKEVTFYQCKDKRFKKYITSFGLKEVKGTFSDISIFMQQWPHVNACNISIGYYNEHTIKEYCYIKEYIEMIEIVKRILKDYELIMRMP